MLLAANCSLFDCKTSYCIKVETLACCLVTCQLSPKLHLFGYIRVNGLIPPLQYSGYISVWQPAMENNRAMTTS